MELREVIQRFDKAQRNGNGYNVCCPCHNDSVSSLSISEGNNNNIVMKCHAGCNTGDILQAVGLNWSDLGVEEKRNEWISNIESYIGIKLEKEYPYYNESGDYLYSKLRFEGKNIRYGIINKEKTFCKLGVNNENKTLYNLPKLIKAIKEGYPVYIVEGEKDVDTLNRLGYTATTCGGCGDWKEEFTRYFIGARVIMLPDNDEAGAKLERIIEKSLKNVAHSIKSGVISRLEKGDITDYIEKENHNKQDFETFISGLNWNYAPWITKTKNDSMKVNCDILADAISKSLDYIVLKKRGIDKEDIYVYDNGVYNICTKTELKGRIKRYLPLGLATDLILNNTYSLLMCSNERVYPLDRANENESLINLSNGLLNLNTRKLEPHTPKVLSTIQLNCRYNEEYIEPKKWLNFINALCADSDGIVDEEKKTVLQEWSGLIISNVAVYRTKASLVLYSALGNTGKSVFLDVLASILGDTNIINLPFQKMSDRFELSSLYGKRANIVGDQQALDIEDSSVFKQLTGGDYVEVEFKGKTKFTYLFTGGILIACNNLPVFQDDKGGHVFERMCIIPCENVIAEENRNHNLRRELEAEKDNIFKWCLEGLYRIVDNNYKFSKCTAKDEIIKELRNKVDTIHRYIDENCIITGSKSDRIKKTEFEDAYINWCTSNEYKSINKRDIIERMRKNNIECGKNDVMCYRGIKFKDFTVKKKISKEEINLFNQ